MCSRCSTSGENIGEVTLWLSYWMSPSQINTLIPVYKTAIVSALAIQNGSVHQLSILWVLAKPFLRGNLTLTPSELRWSRSQLAMIAPVPRARTGPLSNCFGQIPIHTRMKCETLRVKNMDEHGLETSVCHKCGYLPGAWLPGLACPECGEILL